MLALTFGTPAEYARAMDGIRSIHRRVNGLLPEDAGPFPAGTRYSAEDPDLVLWVHLTLMESLPLAYELLVGPLTPAEHDAYCAEAAAAPIELGARPAEVPQTWEEARRAIERVRASGALSVSAQARTLCRSVLYPAGAWTLGPAAWINRTVTTGVLPADLRDQYGLSWTAPQQRAFDTMVPMLRATRRALPDAIALWPEARRRASDHAAH
jgi:uncharacterized protein (DUF2236 family)